MCLGTTHFLITLLYLAPSFQTILRSSNRVSRTVPPHGASARERGTASRSLSPSAVTARSTDPAEIGHLLKHQAAPLQGQVRL